MKKFLAFILIFTLVTACAPAEETSPFEYAFVRRMSNYDLYYLFDEDAHTALYFATNDSSVSAWRYTGSFDTFLTVDIGDGYYDLFYLRNETKAILHDSFDFEWDYAPADTAEAEAALVDAGFIYDPEDYLIRKVLITEGTNARNKADYSGSSIVWLNQGGTYDYLGEKGVWYQIRLVNGAEAWVPMARSEVVVY